MRHGSVLQSSGIVDSAWRLENTPLNRIALQNRLYFGSRARSVPSVQFHQMRQGRRAQVTRGCLVWFCQGSALLAQGTLEPQHVDHACRPLLDIGGFPALELTDTLRYEPWLTKGTLSRRISPSSSAILCNEENHTLSNFPHLQLPDS